MKNQRLFTYVFLFGLLVNGSACGSDHNETDFPETPGGETPPSPSGLQAYMLTTTDTRTYIPGYRPTCSCMFVLLIARALCLQAVACCDCRTIATDKSGGCESSRVTLK